MVAGDFTMHRDTEMQDGSYRSPVVTETQFDLVNYTGDLITLKVRDIAGISRVGSAAFLFTYPATVTLQEFLNDASLRFNVPPNEFELVYQDLKKGEIYEIGSFPPNETLSVMNIVPSKQKEYSVSLERKKVKKIKHVVRRLDAELAAVAPHDPMMIDMIGDSSSSTSKTVGTSRDTFHTHNEFVGLKNNFMTCYLNSLVQSLFFTPELRNALYIYHYVDDPRKKKSIAFALQKLFLQLQFSCRNNVGTEELTNTFGWKGEEVWIQHDIEELYRLLMEHLSEEFKQTSLQGLIQSLYGGILTDYVECLECKNRNFKEELFLALPLPVRVFGNPLNSPMLEEALRSFIVPEILDDKNQYNCERCQKPCDAKKGFSFKKLPYILTIALKRFEFNWERQSRHKLNDKIIFPMILDMNDMVDPGPNENQTEESEQLVPPLKVECIKVPEDEANRKVHSRPSINLNNFSRDQVNGDGIDEDIVPITNGDENSAATATKDVQQCLQNGPNVYQLYAVLVHRGGVSGGHYFSYIRDFETSQWYRCDDTTVRRISEKDIQGTYGGMAESYLEKEQGVAYMLIYRRFDSQLNALPMLYDLMPPHIKSMWDNMNEWDKNTHEREELDRNTIKMKVFYRKPGSLEVDNRELNLLKAATMQEAAVTCFEEFFPNTSDNAIQPNRVRLVRFDRDLSIIENSFDNKDEEIVCIAVKNPPAVTKMEGLLLEVREPNESFPSYSQSDLVFITHLVISSMEDFSQTAEIHMSPTSQVCDLRRQIAASLKLKPDFVLCAVNESTSNDDSCSACHPAFKRKSETYSHRKDCLAVEIIGMENNDVPLSSFCFGRVTTLYVEDCNSDEEQKTFVTFVRNYALSYTFEIKIEVPSSTGEEIIQHDSNLIVDSSTQLPMEEPPVLTSELVVTPISPSAAFQSDIEAEDPDGMQEFEHSMTLGSARDCSDPSTSEDSSLTGSDRTLVVDPDGVDSKICSSQSSPTKVADPSVSSQEFDAHMVPTCEIQSDWDDSVDKTLSQKSRYFRLLADQRSENGEWRILTVRADRLMTLATLSELIKNITGIDEKNFFMQTVTNGSEEEILDFSTTLCSLVSIDEIKCRLGHRLQKGEARVDVYLLQMTNLGVDKYLKEFVLNESMTVEQAKALIAQEVTSMNLSNGNITYCRLRKKKKNDPSRILKSDQKLSEAIGSLKGSELYFQIMEGAEKFGGQFHPIIVRRWRPSEWILEAPQEIAIPEDFTRGQEELVLEQLSEVLQINKENVQVAKPDSHGSIPFQLNPLVIQERLDWFSLESYRRKLLLYTDELFIFVRDKTEAIKPLSGVERQELEKGLEAPVHDIYDFTISPRREMGLIINLARTPPT